MQTIALWFLACVAISIGGLLGGILGAFLGLQVYRPLPTDEGALILLFHSHWARQWVGCWA